MLVDMAPIMCSVLVAE